VKLIFGFFFLGVVVSVSEFSWLFGSLSVAEISSSSSSGL
jgi:hypothetical protein